MSTPPQATATESPAARTPLVSIIVPVYNGERYLRESLDSILNQSYPRCEVLVMDDASTDRTPEIIASYGERVRCFRQPQNRGIYGNMNDGAGLARGDYLAFYHSDDVYSPEIVAREVRFLERYLEAGAVFCQDIFIDSEGRELGWLSLPPPVRGGRPLAYPVILNTLLAYKNSVFRCPSFMVRASVFREVGPHRDAMFRNTSDLEMYLRIARRYPVGILEEYLYRYRRGHGSSAGRYHHLRTEPERFFMIMDLYLEEGGRALATRQALAAYEAHRAEDRLMIAISHYILGRLTDAREALRSVRPSALAGSSKVQRGRLLLLLLLLQVFLRLPRSSRLADLFYRRWHAPRQPKASHASV
jgi:glycosyltransferase involved in cell wall biosynthesis